MDTGCATNAASAEGLASLAATVLHDTTAISLINKTLQESAEMTAQMQQSARAAAGIGTKLDIKA